MANINVNPQHVAKLGYSGFDMENLLKFSSTVGELLPVYYDILQPGDKVTLNTELRTRTLPLASPAMCSLTEHIDWFFVPIEQIYSPFGSFYYGIQDLVSSLFSHPNDVSEFFPSITAAGMNDIINIFNANGGIQQDGVQDVFGFHTSAMRLMDCLGYPIGQILSEVRNTYPMPAAPTPLGLTPILFCAYQKIYMDFFRLSDREVNDPRCYNLDNYYNELNISAGDALDSGMFKMRYRPWKKDFFTDIQTSPIFGGENSVSTIQNFDVTAVNNWLTNSGEGAVGIVEDSNPSIGFEVNKDTKITDYEHGISSSSIRSAFAVEKLLEITRRAGKHYDAQTLAHFGVDVPDGRSGECIYIGGSNSKINIGDVIATAETSEAPLGQLAGKGYGYDVGHGGQFEAKCHGVLMGIYSCVPDVDYTNTMVDKLNNLRNRENWFIPEFENLGMEPLFAYQAKLANNNTIRLGWTYRYRELKQKYNVVRGAIANSLKYWSPQRNMTGNTLRDFLVSPWYLDDIMLVNYSPDDSSAFPELPDQPQPDTHYSFLYDRDPLVHELFLNVKKASKMSTYGLPNL